MKTQSHKPYAEVISTISFPEKKMTDIISENGSKSILQDMHADTGDKFSLSSSRLSSATVKQEANGSFHTTTKAILNRHTIEESGHTIKHFFMKTFLPKCGLLVILFAIAGLFLASNAVGQTTVFTDNYNRTTLSPGGTPSMTYTSTNGFNSTSAISASTFLQITSSTSSFAGISYVTGPLTTYSAPFNRTLSSNTGVVTWTFNMRYSRTTAPTGFTSGNGNYGIATVLAANGTNLTSASGYAVVYGGSDASQRYKLIRFANGLDNNTNVTNIISNTAGAPANVNDFVSIRVTYDPSTNNWSMFLRDDGTTAWADPSTGVTTQIGAATADNTFTSTQMSVFGFLWNYGNSTGQNAQFDNFTASVCAAPSQPGTITGTALVCSASSQTYSVTNVAGVTYTWAFPAGWTQTGGGTTNSVTVTVGSGSGNITVTPSNTCGTGTASTLAVTTSAAAPSQPSAISGSATPCAGSSQTYSVTNVTG